jgi:ribonuclease BN (tRNA processing enzyme)
VTSSSKNLQKVRLDFYESGVGETIVITFPSGGIGIVDAHPSKFAHRPEILKLVEGKKIHFVCLSHPHKDHGIDLVQVLEKHTEIKSFWHTIYQIPAFIYGIEETVNFPSKVQKYASAMNQDWAEFFVDIIGAVVERDIPTHELRSNIVAEDIDGVEIHCLSPDETVQNSFFKTYKEKLKNPKVKLPDPNLLSAVLALRFGESVVLLGADALKENWEKVFQHYHKRKLPKARILKVPHHGARNAIDLRHNAKSYLDVCSHEPKAKAVIFAGDAKHPDDDVFNKIRLRTDTICLSNGRKPNLLDHNPLALQLPGATYVYPAPVCNPVVSFEIDAHGNVSLVAGTICETKCFSS